MPPKIKTSKEDITKAAFELVREQGFDALNARSLAARLGCSVQPLFRAFENMEDLKETVLSKVKEYYSDYLRDSMNLEDGLVGLEMAYIRFAKEEKYLFQWLHMSDRYALKATSDFSDVGINKEIVEMMAKMTGLSFHAARKLYEGCFFTAHGMATMLATNHCELSEENIREIMDSVFYGLVMKLKSEDA